MAAIPPDKIVAPNRARNRYRGSGVPAAPVEAPAAAPAVPPAFGLPLPAAAGSGLVSVRGRSGREAVAGTSAGAARAPTGVGLPTVPSSCLRSRRSRSTGLTTVAVHGVRRSVPRGWVRHARHQLTGTALQRGRQTGEQSQPRVGVDAALDLRDRGPRRRRARRQLRRGEAQPLAPQRSEEHTSEL